MSRVLFVTTELHPETPGGAGMLIGTLARRLSEAGHQPRVLLLTDSAPEPSEHPFELLTAPIPASGFLDRSRLAAEAVAEIADQGEPIEFHDFEGLGYWALANRSELGLERVPLTVRFHGPYDLIADTLHRVPSDWALPRSMEAEVFRMADRVTIPVEGHRQTLTERYGVQHVRIVTGTPPVTSFGEIRPQTDSTVFTILGRLGEVKGSDVMVEAASRLLNKGRAITVRFIGGEGWSEEASLPMTQALASMISPDHTDSFEFQPHTAHEDLASLLGGSTALVVPSRFESFCLAAHEARLSGLPVAVPSLPAFSGTLDESRGALVYEPGVDGLAETLLRLTDDPDLVETLGSRPPPELPDPIEPYSAAPPIRDPEDQLERSTAARRVIANVQTAGLAEPIEEPPVGAVMRAKRLIRPLIPDRLVARYRLHQHSRSSRVNVDVFLEDESDAKRWLNTTPDTYRVRFDNPTGDPPDDLVIVDDPALPVDPGLRARAKAAVADPDLAAVVVAETPKPGLVDRRRSEPPLGPRLIAVRGDVLKEVGGVPGGDHPLPGLLSRLRDAGHHLGLIPIPKGDAPRVRSDPIDLDSVVVMSAVPMHDIGGGSRSSQIAQELLKQGYHVAYVSMYEAQESVDLGLRFIHPNLEQYRIDQFDVAQFVTRARKPRLVLLEAPAPVLIEPAVQLRQSGWELVYDVIDDWSDPALGSEWFSNTAEAQLVSAADRVVASAPDLVRRVESLGREADLIPNAVNAGIFGVDLPPRPSDLPEAELIIGYHGSLYGDWFDWDGLQAVAEAYPEAAVVVIGDDKAPHPPMPGNVHFLGLKPQTDLPAYLQRFDVGLIPFEVTDTTHAVSPLKVYEYLAAGIPVAAPPLRALEGLEDVYQGEILSHAVRSALSSEPPVRERVLNQHGWATRLSKFTGRPLLLNHESPAPGNPVQTGRRPARHWSSSQRTPAPDI